MLDMEKVREIINISTIKELLDIDNMLREAIKHKRKIDVISIKQSLRVGSIVLWQSKRSQGTESGTVEKINITKAIVRKHSDNICWNIPISMLSLLK
jgi:hypothetical protein